MNGSRGRVVATIAAVAVVSTAAGFVASTRVHSPEEVASRARAPKPSVLTAAVERRVLRTEVVFRADAGFSGAVDVRVELGGLETPAVVTGRVPRVGAELTEGSLMLEVVGRPVIVLGGDLPTYRTLRPGDHGPDVAQLEHALARLGLDPGPQDGAYDAATAAAVAALYHRQGYDPPEMPAEQEAQLDAARQADRGAHDALTQAQQALADAARGPSAVDRLSGEADVHAAQRALDAARAGGKASEIAAAADQLAIALARLTALLAPPDTTAARATVDQAAADAAQADADLAKLNAGAGTPLPVSEVVYLPYLPRRVDALRVALGGLVNGPVMSVSGAGIVVKGDLDAASAALVHAGMTAALDDGSHSIAARIVSVHAAGAAGSTVALEPAHLSAAQAQALRGQNVKVTVAVQSTHGSVLAVPLAGLTTAADGRSRVRVERRGGGSVLVPVTVGLAADGYVAITPRGATLAAGDRVVVG